MISDQSPRLRHQLAEKNVLARINVGDFKITAQIGFKYHKKRGLSRGWLDQQKPQILPVFKSIRGSATAYNVVIDTVGPSGVGVYSLRLGRLYMPREGLPPTPDCP